MNNKKAAARYPHLSRRFNWTMLISRAKKAILIVEKKALDRGSGSLVIAFENLNHYHLGLVEWFLRLLPKLDGGSSALASSLVEMSV